jgi:hypothetical protein
MDALLNIEFDRTMVMKSVKACFGPNGEMFAV